MAAAELNKAVEHLRSVLVEQDAAGVTDGDLLTRYVRHQDAAAFAALVRRHGPMVLAVCRRVLHNPHDAEDAFQATFLVLVRKASAVRCPGLVGNWLYGVAYRTAQHARRALLKRRTREAEVVPKAEAPHDAWTDLRDLLDRELERLPDRYRAAVVLCDLEGATGKEAAVHLGLPAGTVASRLARGRALLAKRLARHGFAGTGAAVAGMVSQEVAAGVPAALVSTTIKAASLFAAGQAVTAGVISAHVAALAEGVLRTMLHGKLKVAAVLLMACVLGAGVGASLLHGQTRPADPATAQAPADERGSRRADPRPRPEGKSDKGVNVTTLQARLAELEAQVNSLTKELAELRKALKPLAAPPAGKRKIHVFPLRKLQAEEVATTLRELFAQSIGAKALNIATNASTNTILIQGGPEDVEEIQAVVTRLEAAEQVRRPFTDKDGKRSGDFRDKK
jgi:RNA polymerase sigma factor (sigma-70 family)